MTAIAAFFKKIRLRQILFVLLAASLVFTSTACNSGDLRGARPMNPPVQAGGQNNPHKAGGDGYTQYKMTTTPSVKQTQPQSSR